MTFNSVTEIFDSIDDARGRLCARVAGLTAEQERFRPAPEAWSVAEIVEHLSIIERNVVQLAGMMLKKAEAAAPPGAETQERQFAPVSIEPFLEVARTRKYTAPERVRPSGAVPVADSLASLRETRAALHALRPLFERADGAAHTYPHPAFGPLNLHQWLAFVGAHEERHLAQIEGLMESPEFKANGGAETTMAS